MRERGDESILTYCKRFLYIPDQIIETDEGHVRFSFRIRRTYVLIYICQGNEIFDFWIFSNYFSNYRSLRSVW